MHCLLYVGSGCLGPEDLPNVLNVEGTIIAVNYVELITIEIVKNQQNFIQASFLRFSDKSNGILFFVGGQMFSLLWDTKSFFLFDSHGQSLGEWCTFYCMCTNT